MSSGTTTTTTHHSLITTHQPLRILQLNSARKYIGEAAHTLNLTEALRRSGHSVWLGLRKNYDTIERAAARGLDPIGFFMPHRWWPPQDGRDIHAIARLIRDQRIDIVHAHRGKDHWQAILATRLSRSRIPVIRTRHVVTSLSANPANRWLARRTATLVCVSKAVETDVRRTGIYTDRVKFIPGGIDLELFKPAADSERQAARKTLNLEDSARVAVCVARFAKVKAHRVLLAAWKKVSESIPAARLLLVGDGQFYEESRAQVSTLGISNTVTFLGRRNDVAEILSAADLGVLSSIGSEGFSRAVLEYMAKALPTVATRVGAVPDLIDDGVHGIVIEPDNADALAGALTRAFSTDALTLQAWGKAAREKAERSHGYEHWAKAHEMLYRSILENSVRSQS
jgi:glycosyltransferase involved in cell wall biosynthesis